GCTVTADSFDSDGGYARRHPDYYRSNLLRPGVDADLRTLRVDTFYPIRDSGCLLAPVCQYARSWNARVVDGSRGGAGHRQVGLACPQRTAVTGTKPIREFSLKVP